ncbi:MAG: heme exporter protein CcmD [Pseudomonadota bacterium]
MMPDLGKYAIEVLSAYAFTLTLLGVLVVWTLYQGARVKEALRAFEDRRAEAARSQEAAE